MTILINSGINVNGSVNYGQLTQTQINALSPSNGDTVWNLTTGEGLIRAGGAWVAYSTGQLGPQGPQGPQGDSGTAATVSVGTVTTSAPGSSAVVTNVGTSSAAVFDFTLPRGIQGPTGDTGVTGPAGAKGDPGDGATVSVGTTNTLPAGSSATVTNVGSSQNAIFEFGIPQGIKGDQGDAGNAATISVGSTSTGLPGTNASVVNVGTSNAAVFNFTIPRGDVGETGATGATGAKGDTGSAATIAVGSTNTLPAGSSATVVNTGSSSAAIFDFGIPQGAKGDTGNTGPQGAQGIPGVVSASAPITYDSPTQNVAFSMSSLAPSPVAKSDTIMMDQSGALATTTISKLLNLLTASSPLSYSNATQNFTIQTASGSQDGALSSTDWTTFNSKLASSSVVGTSPLSWDSGTSTMSIQTASSSQAGALSSTDWTTFNNKASAQKTISTLATGQTITISAASNNTQYLANSASNITIALTTATGFDGATFNIKNIGAGLVTVDPAGAEPIDGQSTIQLSQYQAVSIIANSGSWYII